MSQPEPRKLFSVERRAMGAQQAPGADTVGAMAIPMHPSSAITNDALMEELRAMRAEIAEIRNGAVEAVAAPVEDVADEVSDVESIRDVQVEIAQMVRVIGRAKQEIAAIKHPMAASDQMQTASMQLETIVQTTEEATENIMTSTDTIEDLLKQIQALSLDNVPITGLIEDASASLISIIEACSFQDLTGQRITQVIKTLRFIEERILAMIDIWGLDAFQGLPVPTVDAEDGAEEDALLNGPALAGGGLSQDDIDALFD